MGTQEMPRTTESAPQDFSWMAEAARIPHKEVSMTLEDGTVIRGNTVLEVMEQARQNRENAN